VSNFNEVAPFALSTPTESITCKCDGLSIDILVDDAAIVISERDTAMALMRFLARVLGGDKP
jgi:hypothetical protein